MEENRFIVSCQNGDYTAFGQLYDIYIRKIYDFLYFRTLHKQTAEDLTSTVFTKALEKIKQFDAKKAKFSTWLYQIAKNTLIDHFRTLRQTNDIQGIWDMPSDIDIERDADTVLLLEKVRTHIKELPALQRDIVIMRLWDGLPYREIAEVLNISEVS
ncbi:MAG: sigma-70 family RNA polymerase sigma factor [Candidatus Doudnabacteria bacterium]|nr:sigma-70 family RNA polymerase sigma factor [Candidatus Doudnabacteria bacterium]